MMPASSLLKWKNESHQVLMACACASASLQGAAEEPRKDNTSRGIFRLHLSCAGSLDSFTKHQ